MKNRQPVNLGQTTMASESWRGSRSSRSTGSTQRMLLCHYRIELVLRVSGTKENPGRRFWGCVRYVVKEQCEFFEWAGKVQIEEEAEKERMRKKVSSLKTRLKACEMRLKIAVFVAMFGWILVFSFWLHNLSGRPHHQWLL
ncbi:hypothetical protein PIB30_011532 [Stylosanthes scabra]|uniref:GRF-type domain-containing protein n=1 Tax=Stylosanthes scabra TaxID=79078 RepID=A0ABU6T5Q8_9FABA|nr:hypothetical protein [Stylosanthes scabra]